MELTSSYLGIYRMLRTRALTGVDKVQHLIEEDDLSASDELYSLLNEMDYLFRRNRITQFSEVAAYRANLLSSRIALDYKIPIKKKQLQAVTALIPNVSQTLKEALIPLENYLSNMRETLRNMMEEAFQTQRVQWNEGLDFAEFIKAMWRMFNQDPVMQARLKPYKESISEQDALEILAEEFRKSNVTR